MEPQTQKSKERRSQTKNVVNDLIRERQEVLIHYAGLAGLEPYTPDKPVNTQLQEFCQLLVDYIASGHFGLYQRISEGKERRTAVLEIAGNIYPKISETTERAVNFNDYYEVPTDTERLDSLPHHLSELGEDLATRIELEDRLISALMD